MRSCLRRTAAILVPGALSLSAVLLLCSVHLVSANAGGQGSDAPPVVKITAPKNNSAYSWNSLVNYSVIVTYQGKSTEYQEIPAKEVLLKTTYVADLSAMAGKPAPAGSAIPAGILYITNSTCLGCHQFKAKAMGPSFAAIGERYSKSGNAIDALSEHIHEGSTGVWGQGAMPPQTQFTPDQLHAIVGWIVNDAANPNVNYYVGTDGAFRMNAVGTPSSRAGVIVSANYVDQSAGAVPEKAAHGEDTVIVDGK